MKHDELDKLCDRLFAPGLWQDAPLAEITPADVRAHHDQSYGFKSANLAPVTPREEAQITAAFDEGRKIGNNEGYTRGLAEGWDLGYSGRRDAWASGAVTVLGFVVLLGVGVTIWKLW